MKSQTTLRELIESAVEPVQIARGDGATPVAGISCDSRRIAPGEIFAAISGHDAAGLRFARSACAAGAAAVAVDEAIVEAALDEVGPEVPILACSNLRRFVAEAAATLAGHPSRRLRVVAITGTSGKTTTSWLLESILSAAGAKVGLIGTIEYRCGAIRESAPLTTPDAVALQDLLARMEREGATHVVLEASSHALAQDRLWGLACDVGVYTNLARDHLDFHESLEAYGAAKARLFREILPRSVKPAVAVLGIESSPVAALADQLAVGVLTFGATADVHASQVCSSFEGTRGVLHLRGERVPFDTRLVGEPHLQNILAAAAAALALGVPASAIADGIGTCAGVPGRLEPILEGQPFAVFVDYAHKPDALARTLATLRPLTQGRLVAVFGCGGDRDAGKRPQMGEIAARGADLVLLTSDNPRGEDPLEILAQIETGVRMAPCVRVSAETLGDDTPGTSRYTILPDRRQAIQRAIEIARPGDVVLLAGKGHEDYQVVGHERLHLDDREEARRVLRAAPPR